MLINTSGRQNHKINDQFSVIKVTKGQTCDSAISKIHVMRHSTCEVSWFYEKKAHNLCVGYINKRNLTTV